MMMDFAPAASVVARFLANTDGNSNDAEVEGFLVEEL